jgi:hypothetical protein
MCAELLLTARVCLSLVPVASADNLQLYAVLWCAMQFGKAAAMGGAGWVLYKIVKSIPPIPVSATSALRSV